MQAGQGAEAVQEVRSSLAVISMAAMKQPHLVAERLDLLLKVGSLAIAPPSPLESSLCMHQLHCAAATLDSMCIGVSYTC